MQVRFQCVPNCGKCCHFHSAPDGAVSGGINLEIYASELLDFWERFPLQLVVAVYREESLVKILRGDGLSNAQTWQLIEESYGRMLVNTSEGGRHREERLYWQARIVVLGVQDTSCHALAPDMSCSIYDDRPLACRLFPIISEGPDRSAGRVARDTLQRLQHLLKYNCDTGPTAPIVVKDGAVPAYAVEIRSQIALDRKALKNLLRPHPVILKIAQDAPNKLLNEGLPHRQWHTSIGPLIWTLWQQNLFGEVEFDRLTARQVALVSAARQRAIINGTNEVQIIDSILQDYGIVVGTRHP